MQLTKLASLVGFVLSLLLFVFALALYFHFPLAQEQWIWPKKTSALGFSFVGAWLAGGIAPLLWSGLSGQPAPLRALSLAGLVATAGSAALLYSKHSLEGNERYLPFCILFLIAFVAIAYVFAKSNRNAIPGDNAVSPIIRWVFLCFSILLLFFGAALILNKANIFPIVLSLDMQDIYGWFFLGSAVYFFYGFLKPSRYHTMGPMISFLTYDILLIPPYLKYTAVVPPELQTSLTIYLGVLLASAVFCLYYLLLDSRTRMFR